MDGRWGGTVTVNGRTDEVLRVRAGERLRLRILDAANGRVFRPDFGALAARIIAVDGLYLREPVPASGFELAPGNRIDVEIDFNQSLAEDPAVWDRYIPSRPNKLATIAVGAEAVAASTATLAPGHVPAWRGATA